MEKKLNDAIKVLRDNCRKFTVDCRGCELFRNGECLLRQSPDSWEREEDEQD